GGPAPAAGPSADHHRRRPPPRIVLLASRWVGEDRVRVVDKLHPLGRGRITRVLLGVPTEGQATPSRGCAPLATARPVRPQGPAGPARPGRRAWGAPGYPPASGRRAGPPRRRVGRARGQGPGPTGTWRRPGRRVGREPPLP